MGCSDAERQIMHQKVSLVLQFFIRLPGDVQDALRLGASGSACCWRTLWEKVFVLPAIINYTHRKWEVLIGSPCSFTP